MRKTRLLIADDHGVLRGALALLINAQPDFEVVDEAADLKEALRLCQKRAPDVVLLDLAMPGPPALEVIEQLARGGEGVRVLVLTMHDDPETMRSAMAAGAVGYVTKKAAHTELLRVLRAVARGETAIGIPPPGPARPDVPWPLLSAREWQVLRLLAQGNTNAEIARGLGVSVKTSEAHRARIGQKLGLKTRAQLYRFALQAGLIGGRDEPGE